MANQSVEKRRHRRRAMTPFTARIDADGASWACQVSDISESGVRLSVQSGEDIPAEFMLLLSARGTVQRRCRIAWRTADELGAEFTARQPDSATDDSAS